MNQRLKTISQFIGAITGVFAIALQLFLILINVSDSTPGYLEEIIRFISYMTIQVNIMIALRFITSLAFIDSAVGKFLAKPSAQTALFVYIFVVGISYHFLLADIWNPIGWQYVADKLLHYTMPIIYCLYWIIFGDKRLQPVANVFVWLLYPVTYFVYSLCRGMISNFYPYPFIDANELGYGLVFRNGVGLLICYLILGLILLFMNNRSRKNSIA